MFGVGGASWTCACQIHDLCDETGCLTRGSGQSNWLNGESPDRPVMTGWVHVRALLGWTGRCGRGQSYWLVGRAPIIATVACSHVRVDVGWIGRCGSGQSYCAIGGRTVVSAIFVWSSHVRADVGWIGR